MKSSTPADHVEQLRLGLAVTARLVQLMDGRIGYADNPSGGSVFWLELPRGAVSSVEVKVAAPSLLPGRLHLQVLVVDNEVLNRNIAPDGCADAGHERSGSDASNPCATSATQSGTCGGGDRAGLRPTDRDLPPGRHDGHVSKPFKQAVLLAA
jgi:hypothetical protein